MSSSVWSAYFHSQLFFRPPVPTHSFAGQTVIVTGSNTGMGLEAARSFASLGASRVILAVRSEAKGLAAKKSIEISTSCSPKVIQVWSLDLASNSSVAAFGRRVDKELDRLDVVVGNAGIMPYQAQKLGPDGNSYEATITVNVVNSLHCGVLMLRKLRDTSVGVGRGKPGVLTFTGSWTHALANMDCLDGVEKGQVFAKLSDKVEGAEFLDRYTISKLAQMLAIRALSEAVTSSSQKGEVIVSVVDPGGVKTDITRGATGFNRFVNWSAGWTMRTADEGGRTLVHAAVAAQETGGQQGKGRDTHGAYFNDCKVTSPGPCVTSDKGVAAQKKIWEDLVDTMARINPATVGAI